MRFWLALVLLFLTAPVEAAVTVTVLDSGGAQTTNTVTTNSVTAPTGSLLVLLVGEAIGGTITARAASGLGVTWTQRVISSHFSAETLAFTGISVGNTGTITVTITDTTPLPALTYILLRVDGANTAIADGVISTASTANGAAGTSPAGQTLPLATTAPGNLIIQSAIMGSCNTATCATAPTFATFTQDADAGWVSTSHVELNVTATGGNNKHVVAQGAQWNLSHGADANAEYTWSFDGGGNSDQSTVRLEINTFPVLYMSGMEMGIPRVNSGAEDVFALGGTIDQVTVHSGAWALRQILSQTTLINTLNTPTLACRFYFYPEQSGGGTPSPSFTAAMRYRDAGAVILMSVLLNNDVPNHMQISNAGAGFATTTGTAAIMGNTWYRIDVVYDTANGGVGKVYVNGTLDISTTHTGAQSNVNNILVNGAASPENHIFDDIYCQNGTSEPPDGRVIVRQGIAGSPTDNAWTLSGCSGTIETCWSNTGFTTASSANSGSTLSAIAQTMVVHPFSTVAAGYGSDIIHNSDPINAVQITAVAKTSATSSGGNAGNFRKYVNGVGPTDETVTITAVDSGYKSAFFTDTPANLDLYQIGWNKSASAAARTQTVEDMWLMVDFLPPSTPSARVKHKVTQ